MREHGVNGCAGRFQWQALEQGGRDARVCVHLHKQVEDELLESACTEMLSCHLVEGAGHWIQKEQPDEVSKLLLQFPQRQTQRAEGAGADRGANSALLKP